MEPSIQKSTTDRIRPIPVPPWLRAGMKVGSALAPGATARLAQRLFFTPTRAKVRDEERAVLSRGEVFTLAVDGQRVVGRAWGEGATVLLAHGWGGHSGQMTTLVDPLVAAGFRAVALDMPGHGESAGGASSVLHFAAALARAEALFKPVHGLVAHSFGAAASTYALGSGLAARRVVFFAPPARFESFWQRFRAGTGLSDDMMRRMLHEAEGWLKIRFDGSSPIDLAPRMTAPLLAFHDPEDREALYEEGAELVSAWPGATLRPVAKLGHLRILRDPACIGEAVEFLRVASA
jgi:pimeloyl-ACP methyl ester carboxylesterase